ncbi:hypothetical protein [Streptomyces bugieae]|uniref:Uncharacterized protein n=1 Tax=Streptomyces bugieae TaxID=3098223 RepID=A0ABU7NXZ7_9ACTN|nr:hypothetical protein [Streptomyces sp. DSM 41528]
MPTAIAVTSPDLTLPSPLLSTPFAQGGAAVDGRTPAAVVLPAPHLAPLDDALTETSAVLEHHGHLVALYSSACPPEHIRRLHTLRAVLESDRIAIVPVSLPPLGVALLARQLRQLSLCDFSPGVLASAARLLTHYIHAGALLGSVTGLDRIEVDLRAHVKSWLPGAHFAVLAHPEPQLVHLDRHATEAGLRPPGFATELAVARGQLTTDWVTGALAPAWQVQGAYEVRLPAESARWWGTQKLIEFAAGIPDPAILRQLVASVRREECGWCGLEVLGDRCAFCTAPLARDRAARGGGSAGRGPAAIAGPGAEAANAPRPAADRLPPRSPDPQALPAPGPAGESPAAPAPSPAPDPSATPSASPSPAPSPAPAPQSGPPPSAPWAERGLAPVAPSGVPGGPGVPDGYGGAPAGRGVPGEVDVRGPDLPNGVPGPGVPGNPYGSGRPVPGNPYATDVPRTAPGRNHLPGHPDFAGEPDVPGVSGVPGTPRTVARAR